MDGLFCQQRSSYSSALFNQGQDHLLSVILLKYHLRIVFVNALKYTRLEETSSTYAVTSAHQDNR